MRAILLLHLLMVASQIPNAFCADDRGYCFHIVQTWAAKSLKEIQGTAALTQSKETMDYVLFLHVPRTGGRGYSHCSLKRLYTPKAGCQLSYDKLRFHPGCSLIATHDDYSVMSRLPINSTSVVTVMRSPVERVLSVYEFAVEVASRFLTPRNSSSDDTNLKAFGTLRIWPWKYLVPWMRQDLFDRRDARELQHEHGRRLTFPTETVTDSYNMPTVAMPLHDFIHQPLARELVHNGATFQVAGIANTSHHPLANGIRQCVTEYPDRLGQHVVEVAKRRLDKMLFVGITERHKESATALAKAILLRERAMPADRTLLHSHALTQVAVSNGSVGRTQVSEAMNAYENCISKMRGSQKQVKSDSLLAIAPVNFSKEARSRVHENVIKEIETLNALDVQLYDHARTIFEQRLKSLNLNEEDEQIEERGDLSTQEMFSTTPSPRFSSGESLVPVHWREAAILVLGLLFIFSVIRAAGGEFRNRNINVQCLSSL